MKFTLSSIVMIAVIVWLAPLNNICAHPAAAPAFDIDSATEAYLSRLSPEEKTRSDEYFEGFYWLQLWTFLYTLAVAALLLETRLSARMRDLAERLTRRRPLQTGLYSMQYVLLTGILFLPLAVYDGFFREHQYGLATRMFPAWLRDHFMELGISTILLSLFLMLFYGILRRAPRTWWLWGSVLGIVFLTVVLLVVPTYVEPLFNTYSPLDDEGVRGPVLSIARANGFEVDDIYQYDASSQSTRISASVGGVLGAMSIRINDNMLERCSPAEIKAGMAHEIGHVVMHHVYRALFHLAVALAAGLALIRWSFNRLHRRWGERWGVKGIGDVAGLPLLAFLFAALIFFMTPLLNTYVRVNESEADLFALNASREPDGLAEIALKLGEYRKLDPGSLEEWIFFDHPSGRCRIRMAMTWKAEHLQAVAGICDTTKKPHPP